MTKHITVTNEFATFIMDNEVDLLSEAMVGKIKLSKDKKTKTDNPEFTGDSSTTKVKGSDSRQVMKRTKSKEVNRGGKAVVTPAQKKSILTRKKAIETSREKSKAAKLASSVKEGEDKETLPDAAERLRGKGAGAKLLAAMKKNREKNRAKSASGDKDGGLGSNKGKIG